MKYLKITLIVLALVLTSCTEKPEEPKTNTVEIHLNDTDITITGDTENSVYTANDIIYYESGHDFTYGEGGESDAHTPEEAAEHTVVHITRAGDYKISGKLSKGQIAVDLGEDAKENPEAIVTLILDGADITCEVAPAIIFYNVYECGTTDNPTKDVDTSGAGANVIIADGSVNTINGSYVARIYKQESVVLSEDGNEVEDAKKLHKYDAAFYSKMSMNVNGGNKGDGILNINAENEGLDSELHLTLNGGIININSGNDGINTNEDGVSVTTVNGGVLNIVVNGKTGEGDGIDSNGWLVINGGVVTAQACSFSMDAGIDSDMGIHINGGTVIATGNMLDRIEDGGQTYAVFNFSKKQSSDDIITLKNEDGTVVAEFTADNDFKSLIYSSPDLKSGAYTLWNKETQFMGYSGGGMMDKRPEDMPDFQGKEPPEFDVIEPPEGFGHGEKPSKPHDKGEILPLEKNPEFIISDNKNMFQVIS